MGQNLLNPNKVGHLGILIVLWRKKCSLGRTPGSNSYIEANQQL